MRKPVGFCACIVLIAVTFVAAGSNEDIAYLTQGVEKIGIAGVPGPVSVFGDNAFAVITGAEKDVQLPLVAAAQYGAGRVVVFHYTFSE